MLHSVNTHPAARPGGRRARTWHRVIATVLPLAALAAGCAGAEASSPPTTTVDGYATPADGHGAHTMNQQDRIAAMLATANYQDVGAAEEAGYESSLGTLGCFQSADKGGMGVHYINADLMDDKVDITKPEALVYELDATGKVTNLVAHEYIVPVDAWTAKQPPRLFGMDFHRHPTLPLWVLHTWLWKDNPAGMFEDWNPAVRQCGEAVPVFGVDLPVSSPTP